MAGFTAGALTRRSKVFGVLFRIIVPESVCFSAVRRRVTPCAMAGFTAGILTRRSNVFGVLFRIIVPESFDRFALRRAAQFARVDLLSVGLATGGKCLSPFAPGVRGGNDLAFCCAAHLAFTRALTVLRARSRRGVSPFAPGVRVLPYRIQRYVCTHRVGKDVPHLLARAVKRKTDKPRALLRR